MTAVTTTVLAKDIMIREPVCVEPSTTLSELARVFAENDISGAPVVDQFGRVVGIVSKTDLIWRCFEGTLDVPPAYLFEVMSEQGAEEQEFVSQEEPRVEDFMTEEPVTARPDTPASELARLMFEGRFHRVVVVDGGKLPIGIITSIDLLGAWSGR